MSDHQRAPVGVRFKEAGKVYYFDAGEYDVYVGSYVLVETSHGEEIGRVVIAPDQVVASEIKESLKPIIRVATPEDLDQWHRLKERAAAELREAKHVVADSGIDLQIVSGEYNLEGTQITFYYTAADRADFRPLVRDLSTRFGSKVQMLQVGERDRAKLIDGYDVCGQRLCCSSWQTSFPSVSIKMAKEQDLPLNPQKISGVCGRLYCCLTFDHRTAPHGRGGHAGRAAGRDEIGFGCSVPQDAAAARRGWRNWVRLGKTMGFGTWLRGSAVHSRRRDWFRPT